MEEGRGPGREGEEERGNQGEVRAGERGEEEGGIMEVEMEMVG